MSGDMVINSEMICNLFTKLQDEQYKVTQHLITGTVDVEDLEKYQLLTDIIDGISRKQLCVSSH